MQNVWMQTVFWGMLKGCWGCNGTCSRVSARDVMGHFGKAGSVLEHCEGGLGLCCVNAVGAVLVGRGDDARDLVYLVSDVGM